ncbi:MAG TPA: SCO family protein [Tepidisphaeraceae bacterium]|nr:SCO family protein [Tepidisphaeraceae bacterium]
MNWMRDILVAMLLAASIARADDALPSGMRDVGVEEHLGTQLPLDAPLLNERGQKTTLRECLLPGKPAILQLSYFACPMLCDTVSKGMLRSMEELDLNIGSDFSVIDVSFDPHDKPNDAYLKKSSFLKMFPRPGASDGWRFLTGPEESTQAIANASGFKFKWDTASQQFSHPAVLILLSSEGKVMRYLYGVEFPRQTLRLSLVEASEGKIGNTLDKVLMICFHYSPSEGKYTLAAMNLMRMASVATVVVLASVLTRQFLKERRRQAAA